MMACRIMGAIFARTWFKVLRRPMILLLSFVQPLIWMLFFGFLFQRFRLDGLPPQIAYLDFLLPGICAMTVLIGASQSGISTIRDLQTRFLQRMLHTPAGPHLILIGKISADVSRLIVQALAVAGLGLLLGARVDAAPGPVLVAVFGLICFGTAYTCLSNYIALRTQSQESMAAFVHVVNMPLFFTSTALVPAKQMPAWLASIAQWNPLSLVVDNLRQALLFGQTSPVVTTLGPLVVLMLLLFALAWRTIKTVA